MDQKHLKMNGKAGAGARTARRSEDWDYLDDLEADDRFVSPGCYLMLLRKHHSKSSRRRTKSLLSIHA